MDDILPGPSRRTVIVDNTYHVSDDVWRGTERGVIECFGGSRLIRSWVLSEAQKELLHMVGFGLFANQDVGVQNDTALVSALVEHWRPETNTFFFRRGEMTVTLQDVGHILGLPILGEPLVGCAIKNPKGFFQQKWFEALTEEEAKVAWGNSGGIKFTWLHDRYGREGVDDPERIALHTQAYLMLVVGTVLFPTRSRNIVHPRYIQPLSAISRIHTYSWGSGVLAYLYRGLGYAVKKESRHISACMLLLQIWSYERFDIGLPIPDPEQDSYPVALYWSYTKPRTLKDKGKEEEKDNDKDVVVKRKGNLKRRRGAKDPHHNLPYYRGEFDGVRADIVEWTPYVKFHDPHDVEPNDNDPDREFHVGWELIEAQLGGQARIPLLCYDIVEYQHSDRVLRQFGLGPCIPSPPVDMTAYRKAKMTFQACDWMAVWFAEIGQWRRFSDSPDIALVDHTHQVSEEAYMAWYSDICIRRVGKPIPELVSVYRTPELFDNLEAYEVIESAMDMTRQIDARIPDSFGDEFREIASNFVEKYCRFMKALKGPAFTPPDFQHLARDDIADSDRDLGVMTQPSQHVSEPQVVEASSSRPPKLQLRRLKEGK